MNKLVLTLFSILVIVFISGCEDEPSSIGGNLIESNITITQIDSETENFDQSLESSFIDTISFGASPRILVGKYENVESQALLKFSFPLNDSLQNRFSNGDITLNKSWIQLYNDYMIGDTNGFYGINVYEINNEWSSGLFNKDSLSALQFNTTDLSSNLNITDSIVTFDFDLDLTDKWLRKTWEDENIENNGVVVFPEAGTEYVIGFQAINIIYFNEAPRVRVEIEFPDGVKDTIVGSPAEDVHVVTGNQPVSSNGNTILQGGLVSRGDFKIDLSKIPDDVIINSAVLTMHLDSTETYQGTIITDSIGISLYDDSLMTETLANTSFIALKRESSTVYSGEIKTYLQRFVSSSRNNYGFQIYLTDEERALGKLAVIGSSAIPALRPNLVITYSKNN